MEIGIDLVEHKDILANYEALAERILSEAELKVYKTFKLEKRKIEYVASRFAAKEALFKALGSYEKPYSFKDASILNKPNGRPYIEAPSIPFSFHITISHTDNYSVAFVVKI